MHNVHSKTRLPSQYEHPAKRSFSSRYRPYILLCLGALVFLLFQRYQQTDPYREALIRIAQLRLHELNQDYDSETSRADLNLDIGNASMIDLASYSQRLLSTSKTILGRSYRRGPSSSLHHALDKTADALMLHESGEIFPYQDRDLGPSLGHRIVSNQKNKSELFEEAPHFELWGKQNPDWGYNLYDDSDMVGWMNNHASSTALRQAFFELPRDVMRSDIFRYLSIFQGGGL